MGLTRQRAGVSWDKEGLGVSAPGSQGVQGEVWGWHMVRIGIRPPKYPGYSEALRQTGSPCPPPPIGSQGYWGLREQAWLGEWEALVTGRGSGAGSPQGCPQHVSDGGGYQDEFQRLDP